MNDVEPVILPIPSSNFLPVPVDNTLENQSSLPNNTETPSNQNAENQSSLLRHQEPHLDDTNQYQPNTEDHLTPETTTSDHNHESTNRSTTNPSNQSILEAIIENEVSQAIPVAVPYSGMIEPEVVYKSSAGLWKYIDSSSKTDKWDPANLPKAGSRRNRKQPNGYAESLVSTADEQNILYNFALSVATSLSDNPTYHEAMNRSDKPKWDAAIQKEYDALFLNETFSSPMDLPSGHKAKDTKMVLKIRHRRAV